jgi:SAM-dependent methyltransferase
VRDAPIAPTAVAASLADICQTVRCGDGVLNPGEGCDSGSPQGNATCDGTCRVRSGSPCNAAAPGATGGASCASELCLTAGVPAPGRCVDCVDDSRCGGSTPRCDPATNSCAPALDAGAADVVTALAVVEHIPDDAQAAFWDAVADALRPGGRCILTVPAPVVDHILAGLIRLRLANGMHAEEHYGFAPRSVASRAAAAGLAVERHVRFQLGCNHLFVLRKPPTSPAA